MPDLNSVSESIDGRHLRYFLTVADTGTVTAAAVLLHVSQPALSQQIIWLETRIGRKLFRRDGRGMHLTPAGVVFREGVLDIPGLLYRAVANSRSSMLPP
ncbi:helix-turn-helix domain-containing protein [Mycetocola saprophilus]|uniref:helix-turn-helix domain-containing protein n=1 Tax=Mycetocola saprophilus TaxID=76636 RepID=UPI003BF3EFF2